MQIDISQQDQSSLNTYCDIPISFDVHATFALDTANLQGITLRERTVFRPYIKDIDGGDPARAAQWGKIWDMSNWAIFSASILGKRVGAAIVAHKTPTLDMLERRNDLALLWDLRIHPDFRRSGIGATLFDAAKTWARDHACTQLKIETQNTNVPANKFYQGRGCELGGLNWQAYGAASTEIQMLWYLDLN